MNNRLIFISYSKEDERWKERLIKHLKTMEGEGDFTVFEKSKIAPGKNWVDEIHKALENAKVAFLLVSIDSLTEVILKAEMKEILERRAKEGLQVFPIIISDCNYAKWLREMSVRPTDGFLEGKKKAQVNTELKNIVLELIDLLSPEQSQEAQSEIPERASKADPSPTITAVEVPRSVENLKAEPDRWQGLEEEATNNPELRKRLYDMASRLKSKGKPTSGSVTFYAEGAVTPLAGEASQTSGGGFESPAGGEGNGNQGAA